MFQIVYAIMILKELDTAGLKHPLERKRDNRSADFQDTGNQMNNLHKIRMKNACQLIIGHLNMNSLRNKFEILEEIIKDKIKIFLISKTKLDSLFPSRQFVIKGYSTPF